MTEGQPFMRTEGASAHTAGLLSASVIICVYTERRWDQILAAIESVQAQEHEPVEIIIVVDHNDRLLERLRSAFPDLLVIPNSEARGLSGGRNCGVRAAEGEIVVFLDDDARAEAHWLDRLLEPYRDPAVIGTGGCARPAWPAQRPRWFPPEFDWVVGCSYVGLPEATGMIRNPIGANMSFRRQAFALAGDFDSDVGRIGTLPLGCEETVFSIRVQQHSPDSQVLYVPAAQVTHAVSDDRTTLRYFLRRCVAEGLSKAAVTTYVGRIDGLESERSYVLRTLTTGFLRNLWPGRRPEGASPAQSLMIATGLGTTTLGYVLGRLHLGAVGARLIGQKRQD